MNSPRNPNDPDDPRDARAPDPRLPPPPPMSSFVERSPLRLVAEALVGGTAGYLLAGALGLPEDSAPLAAVAGAVLAPLALLLTPLHGAVWVRALRYGGALAVLGMLLVSFTGPGRERPVGELLAMGILLLAVGGAGHGFLLLTSGQGGGRADAPSEEDSGHPRQP